MSIIKNINALAVCLLIFLALVFSVQVQAQTVKKVQFPKGKTEIVVKGKLPLNYGDYQVYVLRARKGQTLSVELISDDGDSSITVYETQKLGPGEDGITPAESNLREWTGKLPITSEYSVQVYGPSDFNEKGTGKPYTLKISIR
ncbi:MAG: hypothetical protein AVDCRST_MAG74-1774 [uncultured Pyrinomonadaceae bacterium]|uniref:Uncharacterized protein n=1 Tax=uncultured Pyrinomonadaceae bacterium TaxID=2283094 RepID=A0A6J4P914_9BACT|nr:MAG: hypothetical protein AVDCRST_MAG74-1774 [uncultured Pyrinomonadaceae bacterium]